MSGRPPARRWFLHAPDVEATARVFLLPYSGSGASMYRRWPRRFGAVELVPVQLPGRENRFREPIPDTYEQLAAELIDGIGAWFDRPFAFFGHCGSALTAYEASIQLERAGDTPPARVCVSSQVAPQDGPYGRFIGMDDAHLRVELRDLMVLLGGKEPSPDPLDLYLGVMRADVQTNARYVVPDPARLAEPIVAIGWQEDTNVPPDLMAGWTRCGPVDRRILPGGHFRFLDAPTELLDVLTDGMTTAGGNR